MLSKRPVFLAAMAAVIAVSSAGCAIFKEAREIMTLGRRGNLVGSAAYAADSSLPADGGGAGFTLLIETGDTRLAMYEPVEGCYLGADITEDVRTKGSVAALDRMTGKEHAIVAVSVALGGELPEQRLLSCIALGKTPLITIYPPEGPNPYDEELLAKTAEALGRYNVPVFVEFFPYSRSLGYGAESYKRFFRKAWLTLREYAPQAAVVWSADGWDYPKCLDYYPGNSYADWVGLRLTVDIEVGGYAAYTEAFDAFCGHFQAMKPIMVTSLSISHFTTADNTYYTELCADALYELYTYIADCWPRVAGLVYNSRSALELGTAGGRARNNYLLTDEELILKSYKDAAASTAFLSALGGAGIGSNPRYATRMVNAGAGAAQAAGDGELYLTEKGLSAWIAEDSPLFSSPGTEVGGERGYPLSVIEELEGGRFYVDYTKRIIYWRLDS